MLGIADGWKWAETASVAFSPYNNNNNTNNNNKNHGQKKGQVNNHTDKTDQFRLHVVED